MISSKENPMSKKMHILGLLALLFFGLAGLPSIARAQAQAVKRVLSV
jgi:Sec-independent protein translocase protein TatA